MSKSNVLKRQYGLFTAICLVVGSVIGTGIFWVPGRVLYAANGHLWVGVAAWLVGGLMVATCVYMFSVMARRYEMIHGMVDYAEALVGEKYGYLVGWFFCVMYQTAGYAIISWITASFTATLAGHDNVLNSPFVFGVMAFYMIVVFLLNYCVPKLPMRFHVSSTVARVIPPILMATVGVIAGFIFQEGAITVQTTIPGFGEGQAAPTFLGAVFATAFAYNGWQAATAFNSEIKNSKKQFPVALMIGFAIVILIYVGYYIGVVLAGEPYELMQNNQLGTRAAFNRVFGSTVGSMMMIFVIISGIGILNLCCMGMSRSLYALGRRGMGPVPEKTVVVDQKTGLPLNSMIICVVLSFLWAIVIYGNRHSWWGHLADGRPFMFNLPDFYNAIFFTLLIPIFIGFLVHNYNNKEIHPFNRLIMPLIAAFGAGFMNYALISDSWIHALVYYATGVVLAVIGFLFFKRKV